MTEERAFELLQDLNGMTREEAIEVLELHLIEFKHDFGWNRTTIKAMEMAVEALEEPERWIPVSERLPEANGRYLVTRGLNACGAMWNRTYLINYSDLMGLKKNKVWWDGGE